ncbi:uncharacterized protein LOC133795081 [Humulus lupulus]|uniref:uncharacterized protein LOC133795081 n=1 Tax=Humulus lupulus TaxID=3486 RepID=UPI002B410962|nr:uncharacterized protein LOC133795081 [Humulus lupulus]
MEKAIPRSDSRKNRHTGSCKRRSNVTRSLSNWLQPFSVFEDPTRVPSVNVLTNRIRNCFSFQGITCIHALHICLKFARRNMVFKLSSELLDASKGSGDAIRKQEETHRMTGANRAFAHFR